MNPSAVPDALAALAALRRGEPVDAASIAAVVAGFRDLVAQHAQAGDLAARCEASAWLATALRMEAALAPAPERQAAYERTHGAASAARDHAIEAATTLGVDDANTAAYVRATDEAARAALVIGEGDPSDRGADLLREAAEYFGEAAAGYRRLRRNEDAARAEIQALEARAKRARRGMS